VGSLSIGVVTASDVAGGAEAHTVALARGLRSRGHDVVLYGRCKGWEEAGLPRTPVDLGPKWSRRTLARGVLRVPAERRRAAAIPPCSVYHLQFKREQIALTHPLSRTAPVVWTEHGRWMGGAMGRALLVSYGKASRHAERVLCVSDAVAEDLRRVVDPAKLTIVPNAVDTDRFAPASDEHRMALRERLLPGRLGDRVTGVIAARLHPHKRQQRAVEATIAAGTGLVILGDGPVRHELEMAAGGHPDIIFVGHHENVADYLGATDFYFHCASPTEGMPTGILEAAACGLPIVGFQGDPCLEFVDRCGGVVLTEPAELRTAVDILLDLRGSGVEYIRGHHSHEGLVDAYEQIFLECARRAP
jgi:glycosyltransferase involved in cell wall biosynthesis